MERAAARRYQEKRKAKATDAGRISFRNDISLKRGNRIPKVNPKRKAKLFALQFHSSAYVEFVHSAPCAVRGCERGPIQCAHVGKTRANGGRWYEIAPLCPVHHLAQEGRTEWFNARYGVDLMEIAFRLAADWKAFIGVGS
jgi:hypothetical protein